MEMQSELDQNFHVYIRCKIRSTTAAAASKPQKKLHLCTQTVDNTLICHHLNINNTLPTPKQKIYGMEYDIMENMCVSGERFSQFGEIDQYNQYQDLKELSVPCLLNSVDIRIGV